MIKQYDLVIIISVYLSPSSTPGAFDCWVHQNLMTVMSALKYQTPIRIGDGLKVFSVVHTTVSSGPIVVAMTGRIFVTVQQQRHEVRTPNHVLLAIFFLIDERLRTNLSERLRKRKYIFLSFLRNR